jgi:hypothetical protein
LTPLKPTSRPEAWSIAALLLAAAAAAALLPPGWVLSTPYSDLPSQFAPWRAFATASLKAGHFPLWNPYTYSGEPFFGGFQSALLYPFNLLFLVLPLAAGINLSYLLHAILLGWGMHRWARQRGFRPLAGALCGLGLVCSGAVWPHLYAGHLSNLCTMAWVPWILAGFERWWTDRRWSGLFAASGGIALQILAGHVQYVYLTGLAAGLQAVAWTLARPDVRRRALPSVAAAYAAAALLTAVQLLPGLAAAAEGVRQGKAPFDWASTFFLPAENLVTLVAPGFFGDFLHTVYWGRWYLQEMSVFVGAAGLLLAGVAWLEAGWRRRTACDLALAALLLVLALGSQTPLFRALYDWAPGFGQFRGISKFSFFALVFLLLAIGAGADRLLRQAPASRRPGAWALAGAGLLAVAGLWLHAAPALAQDWQAAIHRSGQSSLPPGIPEGYFRDVGARAGNSLLWAAGVLALAGAALVAAVRRPVLRLIPLALFALQLAVFAGRNTIGAPLSAGIPDNVRAFVAAHPGDYRILNLINPQAGSDAGFLLGAPDIWGNDPFVLRRYSEFITATQGYDPDKATQYIPAFRGLPPIYAILRCQYVIGATAGLDKVQIYAGVPNPLAHVQLVGGYQVRQGREAIFAAMSAKDFDPRRTVVLESEPEPRPAGPDEPGTARVVAENPDSLTIEAEAAGPSLLLITDPYSRDWRAVSLPGSAQASYQLLPADYILRAVPLAAGRHRLRIEYAPPSFRLGLAISALAGLGWLGAAWTARKAR